jgi:hypothetical protein
MFANVNSVEPPLAPQKQRRMILPDATNDNHQLAVFMKAQRSQVSIRYNDQPAWQMPRACDYNKAYAQVYTINENFIKNKGRYFD